MLSIASLCKTFQVASSPEDLVALEEDGGGSAESQAYKDLLQRMRRDGVESILY